MKLLTKLSLIAAVFAAIGPSAAFADDQQLQNRLALQRAQMARDQKTTTIAVYAGERGVGRKQARTNDQRAETRFELRSNAHGQTFGVFVPVK
jgi:hypothetical protein